MSRKLANSFKTLGLFAVLWGVVMGLGLLVAGGTGNAMWLWVFCAIGLVSTFYTYWNSATLALKQMNAYPVTREVAPGLYAIVEDLTSQLNMPMPTIWIAPTQTPNAFATGRNPKNAAVCCTEGILQVLDERQLRGVLGHEIMHVYNRDILTASIASAMSGIISTLAQFMFLFSGGRGRSRNDNPFGMLGALAVMLLAPFAASLLHLGISRTREYAADQDGSELTRDPEALARALMTIHGITDQTPLQPTPDTEAASSLMIANPFRGGGVQKLFSTHPPMDERIERLRQMAREMGEG